MIKAGLGESQMILRWIFFGTVLAAAIRALVPADVFGDWFGPTWIGVLLTLVAATVIEVCSEGSSPIAADLVTRAGRSRKWFCVPDGGGGHGLHGDHGAQGDHALLEDGFCFAVADPAAGGGDCLDD